MTDQLAEAKRHIRALFGLVRYHVPEPYSRQVKVQLDETEAFLSRLDGEQTVEGGDQAPEQMRLDAYYYGFDATGVNRIDRILSAVACAGKAYHHTDSWSDETEPYEPFFLGNCPIDWIQGTAQEAAAEMKLLRAELTRLRTEQSDRRTVLQKAEEEIEAISRPATTERHHLYCSGFNDGLNAAINAVRALIDQPAEDRT